MTILAQHRLETPTDTTVYRAAPGETIKIVVNLCNVSSGNASVDAFLVPGDWASLQSVTMSAAGSDYTSLPAIEVGGADTPPTFVIRMQAATAVIKSGGRGYAVGDVIATMACTDTICASTMMPVTLTVSAVNAFGSVTGLTITDAGDLTAIRGRVLRPTGGAGKDLLINLTYELKSVAIVSAGAGYRGAVTMTVTGGGGTGGAVSHVISNTPLDKHRILSGSIVTYPGQIVIGPVELSNGDALIIKPSLPVAVTVTTP